MCKHVRTITHNCELVCMSECVNACLHALLCVRMFVHVDVYHVSVCARTRIYTSVIASAGIRMRVDVCVSIFLASNGVLRHTYNVGVP